VQVARVQLRVEAALVLWQPSTIFAGLYCCLALVIELLRMHDGEETTNTFFVAASAAAGITSTAPLRPSAL
jgi:hypothetical protein